MCWMFTDFLNHAETSSNWKLLSELIGSPIMQETTCDQEFLSELIVSLIHTNFLQLGALIRAYWFPNQPRNYLWSRAHSLPYWHTNFLQLEALIRDYLIVIHTQTSCDWELLSELIDSPIDQETTCDQELLLKLIDSPIDQETACDKELLSELIDSLIHTQTSCDWWPNQASNYL